MASKPTFSPLPFFLLLLLCFCLPQNVASDCRSNKQAILQAFQSRKLVVVRAIKEEEVDGGKKPPVEWDQLRRVPSGPDPLHHNGANPKKPRTP